MNPSEAPRSRRFYLYVGTGLFFGVAYAILNTLTDDWAKSDWAHTDDFARAFFAFHAFVDRGIPVLTGALFGLAFHWLHLRSTLVRTEAARAEELRSRLHHVERDQAVWVVAASTLHELKNPLHSMGLLVDELDAVARGGDADAIGELVARVRKQMDRVLVPLDALRALARRERRERRVGPIGATATKVVAALRPLADESGVELRIEGDRDASGQADTELVRIILDNLVSNAIEGDAELARARHVEVRLTEDPARARVVIRVSDDGPGLPEVRRATLFEPLRTDKSHGLGLGLPIARALARTLGGELVPAQATGFATSFELIVPVASRAS